MEEDLPLHLQTVFRDEYGRKITKEQWLEKNEKNGKRKRNGDGIDQKPKKEQRVSVPWASGIVQQQNEISRKEYEEKVINAPFEKIDIDPAYDEELKNQKHWDDPLNFFPKENFSDESDDEEKKKKKKKSKKSKKKSERSPSPKKEINPYTKQIGDRFASIFPPCKFTAPPNRFKIAAGTRWDGVVRGNDYEGRWLRSVLESKEERPKGLVMEENSDEGI